MRAHILAGIHTHTLTHGSEGWLGIPLGITFNASSEVYRRMQGWSTAEGAVVHAWMDSSWFTNMFEVTAFDLKAGNFSFEDPDMPGFPRGGWQGGRNWRTGGHPNVIGGDSTVAPLIVENVFEELDSDNEFFFDRNTSTLYLIPNGTDSPPPATVVASHLHTLVRIKGDQTAPVRGITFTGNRFKITMHISPSTRELVCSMDTRTDIHTKNCPYKHNRNTNTPIPHPHIHT